MPPFRTSTVTGPLGAVKRAGEQPASVKLTSSVLPFFAASCFEPPQPLTASTSTVPSTPTPTAAAIPTVLRPRSTRPGPDRAGHSTKASIGIA